MAEEIIPTTDTTIHGYKIRHTHEEIVTVEKAGIYVSLGQSMCSDGKACIPRGAVFFVTRLHWPYRGHITTDIIEVRVVETEQPIRLRLDQLPEMSEHRGEDVW